MDRFEPYVSLGLALVAGLIIGFEREQSRPEDEEESFLGGARTYPLFSLVGGVSMLLAPVLGIAVVMIAFGALVIFLAISYADDVRKLRKRGITSEAAFILAFLLGALAATRDLITPVERKVFVVSAVAVVATVLLSMKPKVHSLLQRASKEDVFATLKFLLVAVVVLPLLPNETFGPLDVLNPFKIGLMVVLIAGISFTGYLAIRIVGARRGLTLTALVGGLVSSTAVTLTFSGRARETPQLRHACALAVVLASTIMFPRVLVEVAVVNPALLADVLPVMAAMTIAGTVANVLLWRRVHQQEDVGDVAFRNPFELSSALKFAFLFAAVLLGMKAASEYFGSSGIYLGGILAGATDVDAITLSMAALAKNGLDHQVAATTIFLGAFSNTVVKGLMATIVGGWTFGRMVLLACLGMAAAGALALAATWLLG